MAAARNYYSNEAKELARDVASAARRVATAAADAFKGGKPGA
jgi:hypothetical protein